jgi:hypothetical protein
MGLDTQKDGEEKREFDLDDAFASSLLSERIRHGVPVEIWHMSGIVGLE